ncbi:MAG: SPASM domain-containing protein [Proteobacteria bacterium]|nr:SPASM domain-containing protein [Pseudomonadota bacterium]
MFLVPEEAAAAVPRLSLFTVCMGRRHHLQQTLAKNMAWNADHPSLEFVILDYGSPDDVGPWLQAEFAPELASGRLVYYRYDHAQFFSFSHSRNMAARLCRGEVIGNVDADNFTGPGYARYIDEQMQDKDLLVGCDFADGVFSPIVGDHGWTGRMATRRQAFLDSGGYDEDMVAWGYEDLDLYNRMWQRKYRCTPIDRRFLDCIEHENRERIAFTRVKDIGRDWGSTKGTLLEHHRLSVEKIARGELVANRGRVGIGRVRQLNGEDTVHLKPWMPAEPARNDLRERNNKILEREIANGISTMRGIPNILFLELTRRCNLACSMCRSGMMTERSLDMSEAVLRRIEEDLLPTARVVDLRGWGESLLRRDFPSIVERFAQPGVQLRVLSNGTVRSKSDVWQHLMRHGAWVGISVDAIENSLLQELRGCDIEPIEQALKTLVHWRDVYGNDPGNVYLTVTVSARNLGNLEPLLRWAHDLGVGRVHMIPIACWPTDPKHLEHVEPTIPPLFERLREQANGYGITLQLGSAMTTNLVLKDRLLDRCIHPWMYTYITYAGDVGFCDHLIGRDDLTSGNILEKPFEEIWNSAPLVSLRADHLARREGHPYHEHCSWCFRNRYADFEHEIKPELSSILVTNSTVPAFAPGAPAVAQKVRA